MWFRKGETKMTELKLKGEIYTLEKIKLKDRQVFLDGCKILGKSCKCCFPFYCGHGTKEYKKAKKFFEKRLKNDKQN